MADSYSGPSYTTAGGELRLSNQGQLELLRGMRERGASLRTPVRGWSMAPFIKDGDVVTIAPIGDVEPRVGEVLAVELRRGSLLVIHRAVGRVSGDWLMRGDNASAPDGVVGRAQMLGCVVRIERAGRPVRLGQGPEKVLIAVLSRAGALTRLASLALRLRGALRDLLRLTTSFRA